MADLASIRFTKQEVNKNQLKLGEFTVTDERHSSDLGTKKKDSIDTF